MLFARNSLKFNYLDINETLTDINLKNVNLIASHYQIRWLYVFLLIDLLLENWIIVKFATQLRWLVTFSFYTLIVCARWLVKVT